MLGNPALLHGLKPNGFRAEGFRHMNEAIKPPEGSVFHTKLYKWALLRIDYYSKIYMLKNRTGDTHAIFRF